MNKTVTVVGGGAIGLSTAWELSQRGFVVTVIDNVLARPFRFAHL